MGIEQRGFANGGMNFDDSKNYIDKSDYLAAYNIRVTGNSDGEDLEVSNVDSNEIIAGTRATGINKGIGSAGFERIGFGYAWIYNSQGYHQLIEINNEAETETVIFTNITDTGGVNSLPMDPSFFFNDLRLINGYLLAFTNNDLEPCCINLDRLKAGTLGVLTADDFKLIKAQPMVLPTAVYNNDTGRSVNLLSQNLFQPIYQYGYLDNEDSAWSSMGKRPVPETENTPAVGTDPTIANNLVISIDAGTDRVKTLRVGLRTGLEGFFLVKEIARQEVIALPDTAVDVSQQIYEAYDPVSNLFSFAFYNDGLYPVIDELETDLPYDYVPLKAGALEVVNGSILALADLTEGYDRPSIDITFSQSSYNPNIEFTLPPDANALRQSPIWSQDRPRNKSYRKVTIPFTGLPQAGDTITIITGSVQSATVYTITTFTVTVAEDEDLLKAIKALAVSLPFASSVVQSGSTVTLTFTTRKKDDTPDGDNEECENVIISLSNAGTGQSKSIPALKTNSAYQIAIRCKDRYGRHFPLSTNTNHIVKTQSFSQLKGLTPVIHWEINNVTAPAEAVAYQFMLSANNSHETTLWMNAVLDDTSTNSDYFVLKVNSLLKFNTNNSSSILNYEYSEGDRCIFHYELTSGTKTWFEKIDVQVSGFEIAADTTTTPETVNYLLKVFKPSTVTEASITGKNLLLEIYSPRKRTSEPLFFEIGEQYDIVDGEFSVLSGDITDGDIYLKTRELANAVDPNTNDVYIVEDFHFSDFYSSAYNSFGRPGIYKDLTGQVHRPACIRYSDTFLEGSTLNGITRFFAERIYGDAPGQSSSNYGAINKIIQVDNTLVCIQDRKVGRIPVYISIIEDQAAQENVAVSDSLFGNIRYSESGNYGMGGCRESFAQRPDGTIYFTDPYNSLPIRIGNDGTRPIPGKMSKFFKRTLQAAHKAGLKIIGYYDKFNDEYVVAIHQIGDVVTTFPFNEMNWRYLEEYTVLRGDITITTLPTQGTVSYNSTTGKAIYIPNSGAYGSDSFIMSFLVDGVPTTKRVCINITPADKTPNLFYFLDVTDAELSTVYTSNSILVSGINAPTDISISAGEFRINGTGTWYTSASTGITVENEDTVEVRQTSSGSNSTETDITLTIGTQSGIFRVTTVDDIAPDAFSFTPVVNAGLSTLYTSDTVSVTGLTGDTTVSIVGGEYSINGGAWASVSGVFPIGGTITARLPSSASYETVSEATVTIGGVAGVFTVTTREETIALPDFDYLKITYAWGSGAGTDLDTFTGFIETTTSYDNDWVGFSQGDAKVPAGSATPYVWWAGDNTVGGKETVLVDYKQFILENGSVPEILKIRMNAVWYSGKLSGDVSVGITTYKGGTMALDAPNFDFVNTGGAVVTDTAVPINVALLSNTGLIANSQDVAIVEYNKTTLAASLVLV